MTLIETGGDQQPRSGELALGTTNVVQAALKSGCMAERFIFNAGRVAGFQLLKPRKWVEISLRAVLANSMCSVLAFGTS